MAENAVPSSSVPLATAKGRSIACLFTANFGAVWFLAGAAALGRLTAAIATFIGLCALGLVLAAILLLRRCAAAAAGSFDRIPERRRDDPPSGSSTLSSG